MKPSVREPPVAAIFAAASAGNDPLTLAMATQAVYAAADLGVLSRLAAGTGTVDSLAEATGTDSGALGRLLRALTLVDVVRIGADGDVTLGPLGHRVSQEGVDDGSIWRPVAPEDHPFVRSWRELQASVRTGETAFERVHGMPLFEYLRKDAKAAEEFNAAMGRAERSGQRDRAVAARYRPPAGSLVIDVGGGTGGLLAAMLAGDPRARGVLVDLPDVAAVADGRLAADGLSERVEVVAADMFTEPLPAGGTVYILASILHDWPDAASTEVLRAVRAVMAVNSVLLVVEPLVPAGNGRFFGALLDLEMLVLTGGRERTEAEYERLLSNAGLVRTSSRPTDSMWSILEARHEIP